MKPKIVAFDLDATLCQENCFTERECYEATPNQEAIDECNDYFSRDFVIIYTGRRIGLATATLTWLQAHNVRYHAIKFEKTPFDVYVDNDSRKVGSPH